MRGGFILCAPITPIERFRVLLGPAAQKPEPILDHAKHERLFKKLQSLKRQKQSAQRDQRISEIEAALNALI
jgi:flagellar motility protein MotE (MotC chaperone)